MHQGKDIPKDYVKKYPTSTVQFERIIYTVMEKFQIHSLPAKKKLVTSELKRNWTIQMLEWGKKLYQFYRMFSVSNPNYIIYR